MIIASSRMIRCQDYTVEPLHKVTLEIRASFEFGDHVASMAQVGRGGTGPAYAWRQDHMYI